MIRLTDKEIEEIDIHCGMTEIDSSEPFTSYKYEHHLLQAQLKKVGEEIVSDLTGIAIHSNPRKYIEGVSRLLKKYEVLLEVE